MGRLGLGITIVSLLATRAFAQVDTTVYDGAIASGWQSWSWGLATGDPNYSYTSAPASPDGKPVLKAAITSAWGALVLYSGNDDFNGAKTMTMKLAADNAPNVNVYLVDASGAQSAATTIAGSCDAWTSGAYANCAFDFSNIPTGTWNRITFQSADVNTLYMSHVMLSGTAKAPYVVPDTYPTYPIDEQWCSDTPPSADYTCAQQASWGKCDLSANPWMSGYCMQTCGACPQYAPRNQSWSIAAPIDKKLNKDALLLYSALKFSFNRKILSGQAETADGSQDRDGEFKFLTNLTGVTPAVRLMDFIFYVGNPAFEDGSLDRAIDWYQNKSGILEYQWHWRPRAEYGSDMYTAKTTFDITKAVTPGTKEYNQSIEDIAVIIGKVKFLEKAGVPILFRPLHEPNGGWFWWGAKGAAPYLKLWDIIQSEFAKANVHNVIWVHNFAGAPDVAWYPGNGKVDIVSTDRYSAPGVYDAYPGDFFRLKYITGATKLQAMAENGPLPDVDGMVSTGAMWLYFATWNGDYIMNQKQNSYNEIIKQYQSDYVFNLEDIQALVSMGVTPPAHKPRNPKQLLQALSNNKSLVKVVGYLADVAKDLTKFLLGLF
ncbi:hypothetical protein HDV00_009319 [Rhizophlyctis rosea]|nr:hypothetical protein HDV00_009319 [Rhizophlyctis rosea]